LRAAVVPFHCSSMCAPLSQLRKLRQIPEVVVDSHHVAAHQSFQHRICSSCITLLPVKQWSRLLKARMIAASVAAAPHMVSGPTQFTPALQRPLAGHYVHFEAMQGGDARDLCMLANSPPSTASSQSGSWLDCQINDIVNHRHLSMSCPAFTPSQQMLAGPTNTRNRPPRLSASLSMTHFDYDFNCKSPSMSHTGQRLHHLIATPSAHSA